MPGSGGMAERPNAKLLKSFGMQVPGGSNPSPSAGFPAYLSFRSRLQVRAVPYYPIWSLTCIFVAVLVIYGLVAHGERETAAP